MHISIYIHKNVYIYIGDESKPDANYMKQYSELQMDQLKELIRLTQTKLNKSDRTRVMVCITMDAHARDIVIGMSVNILYVFTFICMHLYVHIYTRLMNIHTCLMNIQV
jgi:hypothetical protein